jgi:hypothetical protein
VIQSGRNQNLIDGEQLGMARQAGIQKDLLAMALLGYEAQKTWINAAISDIQAQLGQRGAGRPSVVADGAAPAKRTMSAAGRRRIAAAQRKRWAAAKAKAKSAAKPAAAPKKRKLSAAGRKAIIEATRKRWAAYRKAGGKKGKAGAKAAQKATTAS